jgi:hypothetical protein
MAAAFMAMNDVHGQIFSVDPVEAVDREAARERSRALAGQFVFDVQLHFVRDDYPSMGILGLRELAKRWNPDLKDEALTLERIRFENFYEEVFLKSQTAVGILSSAPSDEPRAWFLTNDQIATARRVVNQRTGSRRLLAHAVITPGQPRWMDELDRIIALLKPDSWKGYTLGDPAGESRYPWRLDDEKLVYPTYERMERAAIRNVCIHKGLVPPNYQQALPDRWRCATVDDLGKAARDWPQLNFIIYHAAIQTLTAEPAAPFAHFERTREIPWVTDLAEIPRKYGVTNVYAEIGTTFAVACISHPRYCAAILGTLVKGLGADHVVWGTDSVWYGSPQWQIEAMRRLEIPEDMRERYAFASLGPADGPVKNAIFGLNSARMYNLVPQAYSVPPISSLRP